MCVSECEGRGAALERYAFARYRTTDNGANSKAGSQLRESGPFGPSLKAAREASVHSAARPAPGKMPLAQLADPWQKLPVQKVESEVSPGKEREEGAGMSALVGRK